MVVYQIYPLIVVLHILSAVIWLGFFPVEINFIKTIQNTVDMSLRKFILQKLLSLTNLTGIIGLTGIVLTGILMVIISPIYNFFEFKANHWLTTKQVIILIIMILIFALLIPISKKLKNASKAEEFRIYFKRFIKLSYIEKILVLINFLLAALHRYYF